MSDTNNSVLLPFVVAFDADFNTQLRVDAATPRLAAVGFAKSFFLDMTGISTADVRRCGTRLYVRRFPRGPTHEFLIAKIEDYVAIDPSAPSDTENA